MFRLMRRINQQVSDDECKKVLKDEKRAAFSVIDENGYPYTVPVNFFYDEEENKIYIHCAKEGHKVEIYGTGIGRIMKAYEGGEEKPVIETTKNAFKIILPNVNAKYEKTNDSTLPTEPPTNDPVGGALNAEEEKVLEYARTYGSVTRNEVIKLLEVSASTASRVLKKMVKRNLLKQNGKARSTNYTIVK